MGGKHKKGICIIEGCGDANKIVGRGLCRRHYEYFRREGTLGNFDRRFVPTMISAENTKLCGGCKRDLAIESFSLNPTKLNPARRKSVCIDCVRETSKKLRDSRRDKGLCLYCDKPQVPGTAKCRSHLDQRIKYRATPFAKINGLLTGARLRARKDGVVCTLDSEWVKKRLAGRCELSGLPFDFEAGKKIGRFNPYAPSIDRREAGGDYTPDNCRMVVMALNVGMNYWGEDIYRTVARAYLRQRRNRRDVLKTADTETPNLFSTISQYVRISRKH